GTVGVPYSLTFQASGAVPPYTWTLAGTFAGNDPPPGLTLSSGGVLSGTPTTAGQFSFGIVITASDGQPTAKTYAVTINPAAPSITSALTASAQVGVPFSYQITATNNPTTYGASNLPSPLSINTGTGVISGTPTTADTFSIG